MCASRSEVKKTRILNYSKNNKRSCFQVKRVNKLFLTRCLQNKKVIRQCIKKHKGNHSLVRFRSILNQKIKISSSLCVTEDIALHCHPPTPPGFHTPIHRAFIIHALQITDKGADTNDFLCPKIMPSKDHSVRFHRTTVGLFGDH